MRKIWALLAFVTLVVLLAPPQPVRGQATQGVLVPIGGGYSDVYSGLCTIIVARAQNNTVQILVLPTTYSTSSETISEGERQVNMTDAETRRYEIQEACKRAAPEGMNVTAVIVPVFTRADALLPENAAYFTPDVTAVFILGGDQTVAMRTIANTPIEQAISDAYEQGTVIAGTSAGGGMLASSMLAGYNLNFAAESGLKFGAADVWNSPDLHGLSSSLPNAILDQHFFQRARLSRLLNAILLPGVPHVGIGVDAYTGVRVDGYNQVGNVFGLYVVAVLDAETYHAADAVRYVGEDHLLSVRNVLVHLLAKDGARYDLTTRQASLAPFPARLERDADFLSLPPGAGALFLGGNLLGSLPQSPVLAQFEQASGGQAANILVVMAGYKSGTAANAEAKKYTAGLSATHQEVFIPADQTEPITIPEGITGILVIGKDQSLLPVAALAPLKDAWMQGTPMLLDNAAAALAGSVYSNHEPTPTEGEEVEAATQRSFLQGRTQFADGLGLLPAIFEPRLVDNNRWGRLFSLAYNHPQQVAFGLTQDAALWLDGETITVLGMGSVFSLDLRFATLSLGTNEGFEIANGLLDVFQPGDVLRYETADIAAIYQAAPTPDLSAILATPPPQPTDIPPPPAPSATVAPATATPTRSADTAAPEATTLAEAAATQSTPTLQGNPTSFVLGIGGALMLIGIGTFLFTKLRKPQ